MRYCKTVLDGYIVAIGQGGGHGEEITEAEYNSIMAILRNAPTAPDGYAYRLTESLEWEMYETPVEDIDPDLTDSEALSILLGGETA